MSLLKTLAKVAIGLAAAKGVKSMIDERGRGRMAGPGGASGGLGGLLGQVGQRGGGLDRLVGQIGGNRRLNDMLSNAGLGGILGGAAGAGAAGAGGGFARKLDQAMGRADEPDLPPTPEEEAISALLLRAMVQAAKSDGRIDAEERARLLAEMEGASRAEMDFLLREMEAPADVAALAADTPPGLGPEVYAAALMAIRPDHPAEIAFLQKLALALALDPAEVAQIQAEAGVSLPA